MVTSVLKLFDIEPDDWLTTTPISSPQNKDTTHKPDLLHRRNKALITIPKKKKSPSLTLLTSQIMLDMMVMVEKYLPTFIVV